MKFALALIAITFAASAHAQYKCEGPGGVSFQQKAVGVAVWSHMPYSETRPEWVRPRLPVTHWAPHDLRRTGRTMLAALGCPLEVAEAILGHLPPGVQGVYNRHGYDAERRHWLGVLSARLEAISATQA